MFVCCSDSGAATPFGSRLSKVFSTEKGESQFALFSLSIRALELNLEPPKNRRLYLHIHIVYIHVLIYVIAKNVANKNRASEIHS